MFKALGREPNIQYIDMPGEIRGTYQYFTESQVENLRNAGYNAGFTPLETAVEQYVNGLSRSPGPLPVTRCSISTRNWQISAGARCFASAT